MSLPSESGAFEQAFEAWLNQSKDGDGDSDTEDEVMLVDTNNNSDTDTELSPFSSYPSPLSTQMNPANLVSRRMKSTTRQRFHAYKAVLKKYSRKRWVRCKKSLSPGSQTDDSGVVSPGCDASVGMGKDMMLEEESEGCLSGDDSPPNIQDDFSSSNCWPPDMPYSQHLDGNFHEHPPELTPSLQLPDTTTASVHGGHASLSHQSKSVGDSHQSSVKFKKQSYPKSNTVGDKMCNSLLETYVFTPKDNHRSKKTSSKHCLASLSASEREKSVRSNGCHQLESASGELVTSKIDSCSGIGLDKKRDGGNLCIERTLSAGVDCDSTGYVSRNGCEIGASDSGAGSQSESCCEESPRHEHDNHVSGHTKSPQFSCDSHRFTVIPSDLTNKTNSNGSPPLVLKLKKCERKSSIKNSPPKYFAEVIDKREAQPQIKQPETEIVESKVFQSHSQDTHKCHEKGGSSRSKRLKAGRKNSSSCQCCVRSKSPARRKRHSRSHSECSVVSVSGKNSLQAHERRFVRHCLYLSNLQTKLHTLFCHLFPRLQPVLSKIAPEGRHFSRIVDDIILLLQQAEAEDDVKDSEELSMELESLTLLGVNSGVPVFETCVSLCRSPDVCLEEFREKVFLLIQLLLPELTLSIENNCYRSHRDLEKFLDKVIAQNKNKT
ncbi:uncharacterized protein [Haliotis cracherodii]|uniref:uncharacterized protein n=1 Tax=Haliotis cracherodii TaxID=6455 RepID=UPI0039EC6A7B